MHLVLGLALLLQVAPTPDEPQLPSRAQIVDAYAELSDFTALVIDALPARMNVDARKPHIGFTLRTEDAGISPEGLQQRHTFIFSVIHGSAADIAGVRPGDRITAIDNITCDTLAPKAVIFYLADYPTVVPLTLEHDGAQRTVRIERAPLLCAMAVWDAFPEALWRSRFAKLYGFIAEKLSELKSKELSEIQTVEEIANIQNTSVFIDQALTLMSNQLDFTKSPYCEMKQ